MIRWGAWVSCLNPAYITNLPDNVESVIEGRSIGDIQDWIARTEARLAPLRRPSSPLLAENSVNDTSPTDPPFNIDSNSTIQSSSSQNSSFQTNFFQESSAQISVTEIGTIHSCLPQTCTEQESTSEISLGKISFGQFSTPQTTIMQIGPTEGRLQISSVQPSITQVNLTPITFQFGSTKVNSTQVNSRQSIGIDSSSSEVTLSLGVAIDHFLNGHRDISGHRSISETDFSSTTLPTWTSFLTGTTPFNLNIEITDLPTGQLAEATITGFDPTGRPNSGTLYLDIDANGLGWYIDPTPWDNSEYSQTLGTTAYRASLNSAAYGHYDLLTTLLHETAHLQGFISGYSNYDRHIQSINGSKTFVGDSFSAILTPDGSHLNSQVYPYDLMNTTLTPGVRKLPSALDIAILNTLRQPTSLTAQPALLTAPLSAGALIAINNGSYSLRERFANDTNTDWYTRGDSQILNGQAVLSEDSPYLSHLSQTFVIPQGAKALQFTLVNTNLHSSNTRLAPGDAFEVALLNHTTNTSVLAPLTGLSQTDALLNIQSNGQTYTSNAVTLGGASGAEPRTVQIDVSTLAPGTVVTLYFDLLGFGAKDSSVTIDDVQILSELSQAPVANNDSATTNQNTAVTVNILENDRDPDGTLNLSSLIILQSPQHGQVSLNPNGTYQPTTIIASRLEVT